MDINDPLAGNQDNEDLDYGEEQHEVQVSNPGLQQPVTSQPIKSAQVPSDEDEPDQPEVDYTPSFFSQRFASDLLG